MKRGTLVALVVIGLVVCSFVANALYDQKMVLVPYEAKQPTQFYAGMDKFLSNVSWMTLVQWEADGKMDGPRSEALYRKLNSLTNLDPLFADAYLDGALAMATARPDLSQKLLDKGVAIGLDKNWKVQFYSGLVQMQYMNRPDLAEPYLKAAKGLPGAPPFVESMWMHSRSRKLEETDPSAAMAVWHEYWSGLKDDQWAQKRVAAGQIIALGQELVADCETKLKDASDPKVKEQLQQKKDTADKMVNEVTPPPTTNPAPTPNSPV